jgi:hypothetical protein
MKSSFKRWALVLVCWLVAALAAEGQTFGWNTIAPSGTARTKRQIVLKRNTFPVSKTIYWYTGSAWASVNVGPGQADAVLSGFASGEPQSGYAIGSQDAYDGLTVVGQYYNGTVGLAYRDVQFAMSAAARTAGPYVTARCELPEAGYIVTRVSSGGTSSYSYTFTPPVYLSFASIEGAEGIFVDNGPLPDLDGDGFPDETDPDDDNDGRPDEADDFPRDPNEKDDFDGDGIGDNGDPDDDNDGVPDTTDGAPYDPDDTQPDRDGDGTPDALDKFPDNPRENNDQDGDGIGDNQDPDDNSPPDQGGGSDDGDGGEGDGTGNPGTGDGGGNPGPKPQPGDGGTDTGTTGTGDTSGAVIPNSRHDVAGRAGQIAPMFGEKLGSFRPLGITSIPRTNTWSFSFGTNRFGSYSVNLDFSQPPFTHLRSLLLIIVIYVVGRDFMKRITV